jgi:hypothetical protein
MNKTGVKKMLEPKFKLGDKLFDKWLPQSQGKYGWFYNVTVIGIHYVLPYTVRGRDGTVKNVDGRFEYTLVDYDNNELIQGESGLGKRRKQ